MNDPWQILELDASTSTEKDVKAAYAKLLKVHRPDSDPEGFQRARSAYESALIQLRGGPPAATSPPEERQENSSSGEFLKLDPSPFPAPASAPAAQVDAELDEAVDRIRQAAASRIRQRVREALAAFDALAATRRMPHAEQARWLGEAFASTPELLAELCQVDRLLRHTEGGDTTLPHALVNLWQRDGETKRLEEFAHALQKRGNLLVGELGATVLVHVAIALGAWEPEVAEGLSRKAYPHLPAGQRAELTATADQQIMLGRIFAGFPKDHKVFWLGYVRGAGTRTNWRDAWSRRLLTFLLQHCSPQWPGFAVLQRTMPPAIWDEMTRALRML